jgi:hypothetical protein
MQDARAVVGRGAVISVFYGTQQRRIHADECATYIVHVGYAWSLIGKSSKPRQTDNDQQRRGVTRNNILLK